MRKWCLASFAVYALAAFCFAVWFFVRFPEAPTNVSPRLPPVPMRAAGAAGWGLVCAIPTFLGLAGPTVSGSDCVSARDCWRPPPARRLAMGSCSRSSDTWSRAARREGARP